METTSFIKLLALLLILATGITTSCFSQKPEQLYQQGLIKEEGEGSSFVGSKAVQQLLEKTNTSPDEVDLLICEASEN